MTRNKFLKELYEFKKNIILFYRDYNKKQQNEETGLTKPSLAKQYGSIARYIHLFARNITIYDDLFLNSDSFIDDLFVEEKVKKVLTDIIFIEGVVGSLSNGEFEQLSKNNKNKIMNDVNYWNYFNPLWLIYKIVFEIWNNKILLFITVLATVIAGVVLSYIITTK